jgi:hypothetical protein
MQFVQFFQVKDCRYLQEIEIIFAGITKIGDVAKDGGTPVIVLADTAVEQQVVPPSERARAFCGLRMLMSSLSRRRRGCTSSQGWDGASQPGFSVKDFPAQLETMVSGAR